MYKKSILLLAALSLAACQAPKEAPFPGEFLAADYILSDDNAKRWAAASQQAEQCIYPNLTRIQQQHFAKEDAYVHSQYVFFYPLEEIIGADYLKMLQEDETSMRYALLQFKKFKNEPFKPLGEAQCEALRAKAKDDLAVVKGQYKSGMVEAVQPSEKTDDGKGAATEENKFFFDIIKWGAALLL